MIVVIDMMKQKESSSNRQKIVLRLFMVSDGFVHQSIVFLIYSSDLVCALNR